MIETILDLSQTAENAGYITCHHFCKAAMYVQQNKSEGNHKIKNCSAFTEI